MSHPVHVLIEVQLQPIRKCVAECHMQVMFFPAGTEFITDPETGVQVADMNPRSNAVKVVKQPEDQEVVARQHPIDLCMN